MTFPLIAQAPVPLDRTRTMLDWAEKARSLKPNKAWILAESGRVYLASGDRGTAEEFFAKAEAAARRDPKILQLITESWLYFGQNEKAIGLSKRILAEHPREHEVITAVAIALMDSGLVAESKAAMVATSTTSPKEWEGFVAFGRACIRANQPEEAANWFELAVAIKPKDPDIWRAITLAFADRGANPEEIR